MAHACSLCGKTFKQIKHLHGHRVDSKLNICRICLYCDFKFLNKSSEEIRKHMKSNHSNLSCGMCNKKFFLHESLDDHVRDSHGGTIRLSKSTLNTTFLFDLQLFGKSLRRLHDERVRVDAGKLRKCNEIVHPLVNFIQNNLGAWFGVSEVVEGGSLGKGTCIEEKVTIDLVVFMKRFTSVTDLQHHHKEILKRLRDHISGDFTFAKQQRYSCDTRHSNRVSLQVVDGRCLIEVNIFAAFDIGGDSTSTFQEMASLSEEARSYYAVSFVKDQVRFIRKKPESVKDVMRLVIHWKMCEKLNISSYTVEIITVKEWERMGSPDEADLHRLFQRTMTQLSEMGSIKVRWPNSRHKGKRPIVMDPANPFNNTASLINTSDQEVIERKAREVVGWL